MFEKCKQVERSSSMPWNKFENDVHTYVRMLVVQEVSSEKETGSE